MKNPFTWFRRSRLDDISDEIRSHIEEKTDEFVASGMSRADAELAARRAFGNVVKLQETARDVWRFASFIDSLATDVRYALRGLAQKPGFTIAVILTLALGIGANTVVFALVNAVVLRPLPYPNADRLIYIQQINGERGVKPLSDLMYADWTALTKSTDLAAAYDETRAVLTLPDGAIRVTGLRVTHSYFSVFGVRPVFGRLFDSSEALPGGPQVVLLSEQLWRERFAADSAAVGRSAEFDGTSRLVIGVLPRSFTVGRSEQYWIPLHVAPVRVTGPQESGEHIAYPVVARLRAGASAAAAQAEVELVMTRLRSVWDGLVGRNSRPMVTSLHEQRYGESRKPLLLLFGAVGALLLTACANIANLALARAGRREREFALRLALGASRWRIVRFVLIENLLLAAGGALLGLLLVTASLGWFVRVSPETIQSVDAVGVDGALIGYMAVVAALTSLLFGLAPAFAASRTTINHTLSGGTAQVAGSRRHTLARRALVVGELAVALVFLTGAGLVAKTFWRVTNVERGFKPERLIVAGFELQAKRYTDEKAMQFAEAVVERVRRQPGVQSIAYADASPTRSTQGAYVMTLGKVGNEWKEVSRHGVVNAGPNYFETIGAELLQGRFFNADDRYGAQRVAIVSESYVRINLKGDSALGRNVGNRRNPQFIVGVIKDIAGAPTEDKRNLAVVYTPLAQHRREFAGDNPAMHLIVRTTNEPERIQAPIRSAVRELDPAQPEPVFTTVERALAETVAPRKYTLVLLGVFAFLAATLAVVGLYSVLAYLVAERTREIGIRIAVGADPARVRRMVLGQGLLFTLIGIAVGSILSLAAVRVLRAWMYEMSVYDAPTFVAVSLLLGIVALVASWLPARRASRVDPVQALRAD
jgi:putative ABC transport system permease protein